MTDKHTNLIVDLSNLVYRMRYFKFKTPTRNQRKEPYAKEIIFKEVVSSIVYYSNFLKVDAILLACDSPNVWRKSILETYKEKDEEKDVYYQDCIDAMKMTIDFFETCTNVKVVKVSKTEADDIISVACRMNPGTVQNIIFSSDKDFIQLIDENTKLYSPQQKCFRESEDPKYDLFLKCIRGDISDNIPTAYYKVRETKIKEAWGDPLAMQNFMETVTKDGKVYDSYMRNKSLIDMEMIPIEIQETIKGEIKKPVEKNFSNFKIMKYFNDNNLKEFAKMLDMKDRQIKGVFRYK